MAAREAMMRNLSAAVGECCLERGVRLGGKRRAVACGAVSSFRALRAIGYCVPTMENRVATFIPVRLSSLDSSP